MAYTDNIIPAMTSNTTPSGVASASSDYGGGWSIWHAFDHVVTGATGAITARGLTGYFQYQFPSAHVFTRYALTSLPANAEVRSPKTWSLQGSNNGIDWTTLDTQTNVVDWADLVLERKQFDFVNFAAYTYARVYVAATSDSINIGFAEIELMETVVDLDLIWAGLSAIAAKINTIPAHPASDASSIAVGDYTPSLVDPTTHTAEGFIDVLPDGTFINCYRESLIPEGHEGNSGRVVLRKSTDDGVTWSAPTEVYDDEYDDRNVAGGVIGSRIVVTFRRFDATDPAHDTGSTVDIRSTYSDDGGATWSTPIVLPGSPECLGFSHTRLIPGLGYVLPVYGDCALETGVAYRAGYLTTTDGATFTGPTWLTEPELLLCEPTMAYGDGMWVAACRSLSAGSGYTLLTSRDYGLTWSTPVVASNVPPWYAPGGCLLFTSGRFLLFGTSRWDPAVCFTWVYESTAARLAVDVEDWTLVRSMSPPTTFGTTYYGYPTATQRRDGSLLCLVTGFGSTEDPDIEDADLYQFTVSGLPVVPQSAVSAASADAKLDSVKLKTDTIGALAVTVTSPVSESGTITLSENDDYHTAHGRSIPFDIADPTHALVLDDPAASVALECEQATFTSTAVSTTAGYHVDFELTHTALETLTADSQTYKVVCVLADGDRVTKARGDLIIDE